MERKQILSKRNKEKDYLALEKKFWEHIGFDSERIGLDMKRPFGNSDIIGSILRIIGGEETDDDGEWSESQREYAEKLYAGLAGFLKKKYGDK